MRLLNDDIMLCVPANPDGQELVANWYMREKDETKRTMNGLPRLYKKYIGHDDNRDSLTSNMPETTNMNRQLFIEWNPQIMYNHHQSGPAGEVIFIPPFRDPVNHNLDPLVTLGIQAVGTAMHERLVAQGKGGSGMRTQANYDGWWNGGMRNTATYHNTIAHPDRDHRQPHADGDSADSREAAVHQRSAAAHRAAAVALPPVHRLRDGDQSRHARLRLAQSRDAALQHLAHGDELHRDAAARTTGPSRRSASTRCAQRRRSCRDAAERRRQAQAAAGGGDAPGGGLRRARRLRRALREGSARSQDARSARLHHAVRSARFPHRHAVRQHAAQERHHGAARPRRHSQCAGKSYPAGSYVVKTAQAFRPFVRDMFEPQDHPRDDLFPGGPPIPPYDIAGWTLAMQMGVQYDRVLDGFDGPFTKLNGLQKPMPRSVIGPVESGGISDQPSQQQFVHAGEPAAEGQRRGVLAEGSAQADGQDLGTGAIWVPASAAALPVLQQGRERTGRRRARRGASAGRRCVPHSSRCASVCTISTAA